YWPDFPGEGWKVLSVLKALCGMAVSFFVDSDDHHVHELVDRRGFELLLVEAQIENAGALLLGEAAREVDAEFLDQDRHAFLAAALVADRVLDDHLAKLPAVVEFHGERVGDGALERVMIVPRELLVLDAHDL